MTPGVGLGAPPGLAGQVDAVGGQQIAEAPARVAGDEPVRVVARA